MSVSLNDHAAICISQNVNSVANVDVNKNNEITTVNGIADIDLCVGSHEVDSLLLKNLQNNVLSVQSDLNNSDQHLPGLCTHDLLLPETCLINTVLASIDISNFGSGLVNCVSDQLLEGSDPDVSSSGQA